MSRGLKETKGQANSPANSQRVPVPQLASAEEPADEQVHEQSGHGGRDPSLPAAVDHCGDHGGPVDVGASILSQLGPMRPETLLGGTILGMLGELPPAGYVSNRVDCRVSPAAAEALSRLRVGLNSNAQRMANGRFVEDNAHVVIWLLEQIALAGTTSVTLKSEALAVERGHQLANKSEK